MIRGFQEYFFLDLILYVILPKCMKKTFIDLNYFLLFLLILAVTRVVKRPCLSGRRNVRLRFYIYN